MILRSYLGLLSLVPSFSTKRKMLLSTSFLLRVEGERAWAASVFEYGCWGVASSRFLAHAAAMVFCAYGLDWRRIGSGGKKDG